uniref:Defensin n=1 Tax=Panagrolaimus davidi TaxID=227884 RepID=A0A914P6T8_9BILA
MFAAVTVFYVEAIPTLSLSQNEPLMPVLQNSRNKRDVMIYDWGCEGDACDRDCKIRNYESGHCTPYALINERCRCIPK